MNLSKLILGAFLTLCVSAHPASGASVVLDAQTNVTTLPILFTKALRSDQVHAGDIVETKLSQAVVLEDGTKLRKGTRVLGHVIGTSASKEAGSTLAFKFDAIQISGDTIPIRAQMRAMADYFETYSTWDSLAPDVDPWGTQTLVGGDQYSPLYSEVTNSFGDPVGHNRKGAVYSRLVQNGACESSANEVPMGRFSADACGLYGFHRTSLVSASPDSVSLTSPAKRILIPRESSALLVLSSVGTQDALNKEAFR